MADDIQNTVLEKLELFERWLLSNGAQFPKLGFRVLNRSDRGVWSRVATKRKEIILKVPLQCILTSTVAKTETPLARKLWASNPSFEASENLIAVVVHVLITRHDSEHFFQPYYQILPEDVSNFPVFWPSDHLKWLEGSTIIEEIKYRREKMENDYEEVCRLCPRFANYSSVHDFLKVRTLVGRRFRCGSTYLNRALCSI